MNRKVIKNVPNLLTFCNMAIGLTVIYTMTQAPTPQGRQLCCYLIFFGALIDTIDGRIARHFHAVTDMGKQLDSFADLVTFGIAPLTIFFGGIQGDSPLGFAIFLLFPVAGAFRLARYNLEEQSQYFTGLPITAAGSILALIYLVHSYLSREILSVEFLFFARLSTIFLSVLMVGKFRVKRVI